MNIEKYQKAAAVTMNPKLLTEDKVANCALGLCDEIFELQEAFFDRSGEWRGFPVGRERSENVIEETGDLMWYTAVLCHFLDIPLKTVVKDLDLTGVAQDWADLSLATINEKLARLFHLAAFNVGTVTSIIKKFRYQGHPMDDKSVMDLADAALMLVSYARRIAGLFDRSLEEVFDLNIAKLNKRYSSGGFSAKDSINRDGELCSNQT